MAGCGGCDGGKLVVAAGGMRGIGTHVCVCVCMCLRRGGRSAVSRRMARSNAQSFLLLFIFVFSVV